MSNRFFTASLFTAALILSACVSEKDTTGTLSAPQGDVTYLSAAELATIHSDDVQHWNDLRRDKQGSTLFRSDGTFYAMGEWWVTDSGMKCTKRNNGKERCQQMYREGDKYIVAERERLIP